MRAGAAQRLAALAADPVPTTRTARHIRLGRPVHARGRPPRGRGGLHAPATSEDARIEIVELQLWRARRRRHADRRRGLAPQRSRCPTDVIVIAAPLPRRARPRDAGGGAVGYYLLPVLRLAAFDDYAFGRACVVTSTFRAARGGHRRRAAAVHRHRFQPPHDRSVQLYRRGLAYLEAGRVLSAGRYGCRAGLRAASARLVPGQPPPEVYTEAARLRAQLMRALGVTTAEPAAPR
jgi:hypothetical protein